LGSIFDGIYTYQIDAVEEDGSFRYETFIVDVQDFPDVLEVPGEDESEHDVSISGEPNSTALEKYDRRSLQASDAGPVVDIMVIYTKVARQDAGSKRKILSEINLAIWQTNMAFENSRSKIRVRLVKTLEDNSIPDNRNFDQLRALFNKNDGYLDNIDIQRRRHGADLVVLLSRHAFGSCGLARVGDTFSLVARGCATADGLYTFAHEVGHQFFAFHNRAAMGTRFTDAHPRNRNYGYINNNGCFRTIMSYPGCSCNGPCRRILYFSNLRAKYQGRQTGNRNNNNLSRMESHAVVLKDLMPTVKASEENESSGQESSTTPPPAGGFATEVRFCTRRPCEATPVPASSNFDSSVDGTGSSRVARNLQRVSLVQVPTGFFVEVYSEFNYRGDQRILASPNGDRVFNPATFHIGNNIKSYKVKKTFRRSVKLCNEMDCAEGAYIRRSAGSYRFLPVQIKGNLSRMALPPKTEVTIFEGEYFKGRKQVFTNAHATSWYNARFRGTLISWHDKVGSMIITSVED